MQIKHLNSSAINYVKYGEGSMRMIISFCRSGEYPFCGVPDQIFIGLVSASSAGQYYNTHIRDRYQC